MERLYLDHAATTPVAPEVVAAMLPYLTSAFGNPSSAHSFGREAREAVERARRQVAASLGAEPAEIVFTSGGTEADVLALRGAAYACRRRGNHIITTAVEHHAVLDTCLALDTEGFDVTVLPVDERGKVRLEDVAAAIRNTTILISVMHANNEVGTVQPIRAICEVAHRYGVLVHTDAVQSFGKIPVSVADLGVDLLSLSGHKIYGPKGVGALYVRAGTPLEPLFHGGGQERGLRPGTENVAGIVGLGRAAALVKEKLAEETRCLRGLREYLKKELVARLPDVRFNGDQEDCLPGLLHFSIPGVDGPTLLKMLDGEGIAVSGGAACTTGETKPSYVLLALGLAEEYTRCPVRVTLGRGTTVAAVERFVAVLDGAVRRLRGEKQGG
jgi:cysteine desulfurase